MLTVLNQTRVKRFTLVVTILLIIVCNALLLMGLWVSGVNLDEALSKPELYDQTNGYCVRVGWTDVVGVDRPMRLCVEWLDFSDPSGNTHTIRQDESLAIGTNGQLYYQDTRGTDYRLLGLVLFVFIVIGSGMWLKRYLIGRYQLHLESYEEKA